MDALEAIRTRRSYGRLSEPAPTGGDLDQILEAGASAPDHGLLRPFHFIVVRNEALDELGAVLEAAYLRRCEAEGEEALSARADKERTKLRRAPLVIVLSAVRRPSTKIPWVDQRDAVVAAAQNILLAAHAIGFGAIWRTGVVCSDETVKAALGLVEADAIVGFLYLGTPKVLKAPRMVDLEGLVTEFGS